jgi:fermentation-respiration switch protein FrsA (DUF1100 family)
MKTFVPLHRKIQMAMWILTLALGLLLVPGLLRADPVPATAPVENAWQPKLLDYTPPDKFAVEESTPTVNQVDFRSRPRIADPDTFSPSDSAASPMTIGDLNIVHLRFKDSENEIVPALLCTPKSKPGPFPLVIAAHGLRSNKAQVLGQVAPALVKRGFAVLAPDMPLHGERPGDPNTVFQMSDPLRTFRIYRQAVNDIRQCIDLAEKRSDLDLSRGVILAGYSMGSWINSVAGPADARVHAMVLMVGGATDLGGASLLIPQLAAVDPLLAIAHFQTRPLLMLSGKHDPVVTPEMARRLYRAAPEPKQQTWYDSGHLLPTQAYDDAAKWIQQTWNSLLPSPEDK